MECWHIGSIPEQKTNLFRKSILQIFAPTCLDKSRGEKEFFTDCLIDALFEYSKQHPYQHIFGYMITSKNVNHSQIFSGDIYLEIKKHEDLFIEKIRKRAAEIASTRKPYISEGE